MILTVYHGLCMALADSVPGVSGETIAFILGFYERFLNASTACFEEAKQSESGPGTISGSWGWAGALAWQPVWWFCRGCLQGTSIL